MPWSNQLPFSERAHYRCSLACVPTYLSMLGSALHTRHYSRVLAPVHTPRESRATPSAASQPASAWKSRVVVSCPYMHRLLHARKQATSNKQQASKQASGLGVRCAFPPRVQALGGPTSSRSSPSGHLVKVGYLLNPTTNEGGGCLALPSPSQPALRGAKLHRCQWAAGGGGGGGTDWEGGYREIRLDLVSAAAATNLFEGLE